MLEEFYYVSTNRNEATAPFRHAQNACVVFCDGHVAMEKMEPGSLDQNLPEQFVGRLSTAILAVPRATGLNGARLCRRPAAALSSPCR